MNSPVLFLSLPQMGVRAGFLVLLLTGFRGVFLFRLPKGIFLALWTLAGARLVFPACIRILPLPACALPDSFLAGSGFPSPVPPPGAGALAAAPFPIWRILWVAGTVLAALGFLACYTVSRRRFSNSVPIGMESVGQWVSRHPLRRRIRFRSCPAVKSPLTYGIFRPVILFPADMDFTRTRELDFILRHEYIHIRYFHGAEKLLFALCLCLHWFNPAVWILYFLANRDMELFCDECDEMVLREHNGKGKAEYARTLIHMPKGTAVGSHLYGNFSDRALEERIVAIMKYKKYSVPSLLLALVLAACMVCGAFAAAAPAVPENQPDPNVVFAEGDDEFVEAEDSDLWIGDGSDSNVRFVFDSEADQTNSLMEAYEKASEDLSPRGSGTLAPNEKLFFDAQRMAAGQRVSINVSYTPVMVSLQIGLRNEMTGQIYSHLISGGSGTASFAVPADGIYSIYVHNPSSGPFVHINISYFIQG